MKRGRGEISAAKLLPRRGKRRPLPLAVGAIVSRLQLSEALRCHRVPQGVQFGEYAGVRLREALTRAVFK